MRKHVLPAGRAFALATLLAIDASFAVAQRPNVPLSATTPRPEYGTGAYTVTVIPAGSFTSDQSTHMWYSNLYRSFGSEADDEQMISGHMYAGVEVPSGAIIDFVGLQTYDCFGNNNVVTLFYLDRYSGTTSGIVSLVSTAHCSVGTDYNAAPLGWQLAQNAHNALVLDFYIPGGDGYTHRGMLGWVEIWWKRAVSPAPPFPSFLDVAPGDLGFQYIEALKRSGITAGCATDYYCPDASLTRRQMAIFLSKALGLHWPL